MTSGVLFRGDVPTELEAWLALRKERGADRYDEVWDGVYVVNPMPRRGHQWMVRRFEDSLEDAATAVDLEVLPGVNVGGPDDNRGPDVALVPPGDPDQVWFDHVPLVVEIRSPTEDPEDKLPFYLSRVDEVVLVDWPTRSMRWLSSATGEWVEVDRSAVLACPVADVVERIRWPR